MTEAVWPCKTSMEAQFLSLFEMYFICREATGKFEEELAEIDHWNSFSIIKMEGNLKEQCQIFNYFWRNKILVIESVQFANKGNISLLF